MQKFRLTAEISTKVAGGATFLCSPGRPKSSDNLLELAEIYISHHNYSTSHSNSVCWLNDAVIVERIKSTHAPFYRPPLPEEESVGVHPDILTLMKQCWTEEPAERPSFVEVIKILKAINKGKSVLHVQYLCNILVRRSFEKAQSKYRCAKKPRQIQKFITPVSDDIRRRFIPQCSAL